jgi:NADP-dependent 3-hydroxy acid dehydrogenase YdfG
MAKTILIAGYGPGISNAVAEKFGAEGYQIALIGRTQAKLDAGVKALGEKNIKAEAFVADLGDVATVKSTVGKVREKLGPISIIQWSAYTQGAGDLLAASSEETGKVLGMATTSLLAAVQAAHEDLKANKGAVLVTNGGFLYSEPRVDAMLVQWKAAGVGIANAAKHKIVGILNQQLAADGVYVAEVVVNGMVKGTAWDDGKNATLDPKDIAAKFWEILQSRKEWTVNFGSF